MLVKRNGIIRQTASIEESFEEYDRRVALPLMDWLKDEVVEAELEWTREEYQMALRDSRESVEANA